MAIEFHHSPPSPTGLTADRRLYLTPDETKVVEEGSPEAASLLATPGTLIPAAVVERLKLELVDGRIVQPGKEPAQAKPAGPPEPTPNTDVDLSMTLPPPKRGPKRPKRA